MRKELASTYDPKDIEDRIYHRWEEEKYFHAEVDHSRKPFTIVIPPRTLPDSSTWDMPSIIRCRIS